MIFIGILGKLKSSFNKGGNDIDSRIDSAFSAPKPNVPQSTSERVLEGHRRFGEQYNSRPSYNSGQEIMRNEFGRFSEDNSSFEPISTEFDRELNMNQPPNMPPPLQVRRDNPAITENYDVRDTRQSTEIPGAGHVSSGVMEDNSFNPSQKVSATIEQRLIDELEDLKAQNSEILRRLQRIEAKMR